MNCRETHWRRLAGIDCPIDQSSMTQFTKLKTRRPKPSAHKRADIMNAWNGTRLFVHCCRICEYRSHTNVWAAVSFGAGAYISHLHSPASSPSAFNKSAASGQKFAAGRYTARTFRVLFEARGVARGVHVHSQHAPALQMGEIGAAVVRAPHGAQNCLVLRTVAKGQRPEDTGTFWAFFVRGGVLVCGDGLPSPLHACAVLEGEKKRYKCEAAYNSRRHRGPSGVPCMERQHCGVTSETVSSCMQMLAKDTDMRSSIVNREIGTCMACMHVKSKITSSVPVQSTRVNLGSSRWTAAARWRSSMRVAKRRSRLSHSRRCGASHAQSLSTRGCSSEASRWAYDTGQLLSALRCVAMD
jgi:hypothetical protein